MHYVKQVCDSQLRSSIIIPSIFYLTITIRLIMHQLYLLRQNLYLSTYLTTSLLIHNSISYLQSYLIINLLTNETLKHEKIRIKFEIENLTYLSEDESEQVIYLINSDRIKTFLFFFFFIFKLHIHIYFIIQQIILFFQNPHPIFLHF